MFPIFFLHFWRFPQVRLSFQIGGFLSGLLQLQGNTQPLNQMEQWLPKTSLIRRLTIRYEICDVSQICVSFHGILPNIHMDPIAGTFANFSGFPCEIFVYTDTTGSIGWPTPAPWLRIGDCFEVHHPHWRIFDLLVNQVIRFLCSMYWIICSPCKTSQFRVCQEVNSNTVFAQCGTFRNWIMRRVCACWHFCTFEISSDHSGRSRNRLLLAWLLPFGFPIMGIVTSWK